MKKIKMKNFKLIERLIIKNPKIINPKHDCFLYWYKEGGFSKEKFEQWLSGKVMDIYEFTGRFGTIRKCPWCNKDYNEEHIIIHNKYKKDIETIKLSNHLYSLLLEYIRNDNYEALSFLMHRECKHCENPLVKKREGKCAIPLSTRNRPRSLKVLGLEFNNFTLAKYSSNMVCIVYNKKPARK